ncbi:MAG: transglycosylase SLT domain-containing protein [Arenimonas sp.]
MINSRLVLCCMLALSASFANAAPKADKFAPLYTQMEQASERYRQAQIILANGDNNGMAQMNKALEDIEDIATRCFKTKGCEITKVITVYEGLLKTHDLGQQENEPGLANDDSPILSQSPEAQKSMGLLDNGRSLEHMVEMNEPIQAAIRDWLTQQRSFLIDSWENYQYMRYLMSPEYEKAGLPEALLFGIMAKESGGRVHSISRAGASGPLQFMYATGTRFGLGRDGTGFDTRFDPEHSARANARYINERFSELNRNLEMTIAAYNGGEGRALRIYNQSGGRSFWSPEVYNQWPAETRDYVPKVIAAAWLFLHPKKYGLVFPKIDTTPDLFTLARASSINELTICLGNVDNRDGWFRVLRNLNPRYDADAYIPAGTILRAPKKLTAMYKAHCVQGPRAELAAELMRANKDFSPVFTPNSIAGISGNASMNPLLNTATGGDQSFAVPTAPVTPVEPAKKGSKKKSEQKVKQYKVRKGDNLLAIVKEHNCDLTEVAKANKLRGPNYMLQPGQKIRLQGCED